MYIWIPGISFLATSRPRGSLSDCKILACTSLFLILYFILPTTGVTYSERKNPHIMRVHNLSIFLEFKMLCNSKAALKFQ